MKVLLVRPNSDFPSIFPPLGLLHIASYLRQQGGYDLRIIDARNSGESPAQIADLAADFQADVVGISSLAADSSEAAQVARAVKGKLPRTIVVMGGAHVTASPTAFFKNPQVDYCVSGEGEISFYKLIQVIQEGSFDALDTIDGVYYRTAEGTPAGRPRAFIPDVDELPMPAWDLLNVDSYFTNKHRRTAANPHYFDRRCLPIMTSRGCPFGCIYCHDVFGRKVRAFNNEKLLEEIDLLTGTYGAREIEIIDDLFNYNLRRATSLLNAISQQHNGVHITLTNGLRADYISDEFLDACQRAGVYRIVFAIESASPRVQKMVRKNLKLDKAMENISIAAARRFSTGGYFMLGFPEETLEEMRLSVQFALESELHTAGFSMVATFPNTVMHGWAREHGYDVAEDYEDFQKVMTNLSRVPTETMYKLRREAFRRFYFNPRRIYRFLRDTPTPMFWKKSYIAARQAIVGDVDSGKVKFW